jgi:rSAM/selenodomain-associated transferase 1
MLDYTAALGIICKTPQPGASKTRLTGILDPVQAADLSGAFIRDVAAAIEAVPLSRRRKGYAVYAPAGSESELRALIPPGFGLLLQADQDFGVVLYSAVRALLSKGHDAAILVNSDSPTLPVDLLVSAIDELRKEGDRVVLGPAIDGGYYLIGLKHPYSALFEDIPWSTPEVLRRTLERADFIGLPSVLLAPWYDVDDATTFGILQAELAGIAPDFAEPSLAGGIATSTRALLRSWQSSRATHNVAITE